MLISVETIGYTLVALATYHHGMASITFGIEKRKNVDVSR